MKIGGITDVVFNKHQQLVNRQRERLESLEQFDHWFDERRRNSQRVHMHLVVRRDLVEQRPELHPVGAPDLEYPALCFGFYHGIRHRVANIGQ